MQVRCAVSVVAHRKTVIGPVVTKTCRAGRAALGFIPTSQPVSCVIIVAGYEVIGVGCTREGFGTQVAVVIVAVGRVDSAATDVAAHQPVGVVVVVVGNAGDVRVAGDYQGGFEPIAHLQYTLD